MTKYNEEFKLMVVQEYLSGSQGYRAIAKKYGVSTTPLRKWVRAYTGVAPFSILTLSRCKTTDIVLEAQKTNEKFTPLHEKERRIAIYALRGFAL